MNASAYWRKPVVVAGLTALFVAVLGSSMTDLGPWYQNLRKPSWQPPDWAFGPAWTLIFALSALSAAIAWKDTRDRGTREWILGLFALNAFLNVFWSTLFFRVKRPDWSFMEGFLLWGSVLILILFLRRFSPIASALLWPYLAWVTFAGILNWHIVQLNAPF